MKLTEQQSALRWFERQLAKLDRRLRKADEKGRIAEVEDIRVRMKAFRAAVRARKLIDSMKKEDHHEQSN